MINEKISSTPPESLTSTLSDSDFIKLQNWIKRWIGITLSDRKKPLVCSRLNKRLKQLQLDSMADYVRYLECEGSTTERQQLIDALTTNETYFFREQPHFDFLQRWLDQRASGSRKINTWCAASSTGEEPYSLAMTLDYCLGTPHWQLLATDVNTSVLATARTGRYDANHRGVIPKHLLHKYCLKGVRSQAGKIMMAPELKRNISFRQLNLNDSFAFLEKFDIIFIRNVLIYFDADTKASIIRRILPHLNDNGLLVISHAESLQGISRELQLIKPSLYVKTAPPMERRISRPVTRDGS